ncbi:MAG: glycyl-tRNA synthetase [Candidatus Parcubacteria bacterium]|jgi:glycyl-tRNA synthetase|nr:glycyl-tRNA synthetase [Candidatus Parcubacteria bacterium]
MKENLMEKIVSLCKRRGFVFPGSEIYGGLAGTYDYGPLGVALNENIKCSWWQNFVYERDDVYGVDASILMTPRVWEASGHTEGFTDPLVEDKVTHKRYRADHLLEDAGVDTHNLSVKDMGKLMAEKGMKSPDGNPLTEPKVFNLLVEAGIGAVEGQKESVYLRGEITQGVQVNFKNVLDSMHPKLPFGIAQIGKAFRNEIVPGNFLFRVREFEQMELQYYIRPEAGEGKKQYEYWKQRSMDWYRGLGIREENLRFRQHEEHERAHYAQEAWDIEYQSPFGWKEAWGIHHRGDWDLRRHQEYSGVPMTYIDESGEKIMPWIIETSGGVGRAFLFILLDAYREDDLGGETRTYLALAPKVAPVKAMVSPLLKNKPELVEKAREVRDLLRKVHPAIAWDDNGNIGKRYRRQDEIGTPFCITVDFDTLGENPSLTDTVTLRHRDSGEQERLSVAEVAERLRDALA